MSCLLRYSQFRPAAWRSCVAQLRCASDSAASASPPVRTTTGEIVPRASSDLNFDKQTHTGQAWDQDDYRLARFTVSPKQVNPNFAVNLIADIPPKACKERVVWCDGGHPGMGHPRVYINLDKPGNNACGYCGLRFYLEGHEHDGTDHIQKDMLSLRCDVQHYSWGKLGAISEVAKLFVSGNPDVAVDPSQPFAELWMGTHPKGPSFISSTGQELSAWLAEHTDALNQNLIKFTSSDRTEIQLPFLFKVLSVNQALSVQSHPNKKQAEQLHAVDPKNYPDANHKPEMSIALTSFEMMCGFRPAEEILRNIEDMPELKALVGDYSALKACVNNAVPKEDPRVKEAVQQCFSALMHQPEDAVKVKVDTAAERLTALLGAKCMSKPPECDTSDSPGWLAELVVRLAHDFPGDVGCFAPYFLNWFKLKPGEAAYLGPNEPHAYLSGDCIECMACSDNTIRAGLTPKFKDVQRLCQMLTYRTGTPAENKFTPIVSKDDPCVTVYEPPVPDFAVQKIEVLGTGTYTLGALPTCSIMIVIGGQASVAPLPGAGGSSNFVKELSRGNVVFIPVGFSTVLHIYSAPLLMFRAYSTF